LKHTLKFVFSEDDPLSKVCSRVIRVAPTGSKASPNVRYAFNGDRMCASQRTDAMCQEATYAPQQTAPYSITSSARARVRLGLED